jgi:hypothetical protein
MSYWIPTVILGVIVIILVAQLPWQHPGAGREEEARLDLGIHQREQDVAIMSQDQPEEEAVHS